LIVSELITNAERHAFRNAGGCIRVKLLPLSRSPSAGSPIDGTDEGNICPGTGSLSFKRSSGASAARSTNTSDRKEPRQF
jgi:two-component sensor histidine kinase